MNTDLDTNTVVVRIEREIIEELDEYALHVSTSHEAN